MFTPYQAVPKALLDIGEGHHHQQEDRNVAQRENWLAGTHAQFTISAVDPDQSEIRDGVGQLRCGESQISVEGDNSGVPRSSRPGNQQLFG